MLDEECVEEGVRRGDIYALMIENEAKQGNHKSAYNIIEEMRTVLPTVNLAYYIDVGILEDVSKALGIPIIKSRTPTGGGGSGSDGEEIQEDLS